MSKEKRRLTREEKRQIAAAIERAKRTDKKQLSAQQSIPYQWMYQDGMCRITDNYYSKTIEFQDINYQLAQNEDKEAIFENWCEFLNMAQYELYDNFTAKYGLINSRGNALSEKAAEASARFHALSAQIKEAEKRMVEIAVLRTHIINYSKTRDVYMAYRKAGYSKKFYEEHTADLLLHKAAKQAFDKSGVKKTTHGEVIECGICFNMGRYIFEFRTEISFFIRKNPV